MPGGQTGGAQAAGRFYRNSSISIGAAPTRIPFDADSSLLAAAGVQRDTNGDIQILVAGKLFGDVTIRGGSLLGLQKVNITVSRVRNGVSTVVQYAPRLASALITDYAVSAHFACDVDVDDVIKIEADTNGVSLLSLGVGGENATWCYVGVG